MRPATLTTEQVLPRPLHELFPFFAEARNLERITPPWLRFEVLTPGPISMRAGALIDYRLRWRVFPVRWRTRKGISMRLSSGLVSGDRAMRMWTASGASWRRWCLQGHPA